MRQDGQSASLTAPNGLAQQFLIGASFADAAASVDAVHLCEAHGTGTALGDPIEVRSLALSVLKFGSQSQRRVSSGKANYGHAEPAAGGVGLLWLLMQLTHRASAPRMLSCAWSTHTFYGKYNL